MMNINNKSWEKLRATDIVKFLSDIEESIFVEFKSDDEAPNKLVKEISAFANTYGGYILLGVSDDKSVSGCTKWNEQRIHTVVHDSLFPSPSLDVKKFVIEGKKVYVIKIEEGSMPPYVTSKGGIYHRIGSGSTPIQDSGKLTELYNKRQDYISRVRNKIEIPPLEKDADLPNNIFGYIDLGFAVTCKEPTFIQRHDDIDYGAVSEYLKSTVGLKNYSISHVGYSTFITIGGISAQREQGPNVALQAGIHNYMEVMCDGSVKLRILLWGRNGVAKADIGYIAGILGFFQKIYGMLIGENFSKIYVYAHKYERLTVLKQFNPLFSMEMLHDPKTEEKGRILYSRHCEKYGNTLLVAGNRLPANDYILIDRRWFNEIKEKYTQDSLIQELFYSEYTDLGYIDPLTVDS